MKIPILNVVETHACLFRKKISRELQNHIIIIMKEVEGNLFSRLLFGAPKPKVWQENCLKLGYI